MRFLILLLLTGCAGMEIDTRRAPPPDWPTLKVSVVRTTDDDLRRKCYAAKGLLVIYGCTVPRFETRTCFVYLSTDDPAVLAHERLHCEGYDHPGESTMRDLWRVWKLQQG